MKFKIKQFGDTEIKSITQKIIDKVKLLSVHKKEILTLLVYFIFILVNVYFGYYSAKELNTVYKELGNRIPDSKQSKTAIKRLKEIALYVMKNEKDTLLTFLLLINDIVSRVTTVFDDVFSKDKRKTHGEIEISLMETLTTTIILSFIKKRLK